MKHYFTDNQIQIQNRKEISFRFLDFDFMFITADHVFSKNNVDQGTEILLETIAPKLNQSMILDYGCGYGVIAVVLAKLGHRLHAVDIVDRAVDLTKINAEKNKVMLEVTNISDEKLLDSSFDVITLNPPIRSGKKNIFSMYKNAHSWLKEGGIFYIVIRKQHGAKSSLKYLQKIFTHVEVINKEKGYWIIQSTK